MTTTEQKMIGTAFIGGKIQTIWHINTILKNQRLKGNN